MVCQAVNTRTEAKAVATAILVTASLDNLATDCLRLSMHFFHPIQQWAQQLYSTALPLSPTSSLLRQFCFRNATDNPLSHVATFLGAPSTWGLLLRTVDVRPRQLSCIATSVQGIITACGDVVNVYDAITFVLRQSLRTPETVVKIRDSPDGSILFFAHFSSLTMWDVQTGGNIHTFTTRFEIQDIAVSTTGDHIACGLSTGSVAFWNVHTKEEGKSFEVEQPVVTIDWLSHQVLVIATQVTVYTRDIITNRATYNLRSFKRIWGVVCWGDRKEFLVGVAKYNSETEQHESFFVTARYTDMHKPELLGTQSPSVPGQLSSPVLAGEEVSCMIPGGGMRSFNTRSYKWTESPPLLGAALSAAVSLNRNLLVQTKDSIQIFSTDILKRNEAHDDIRSSHIYPLDETHIIRILQPKGRFGLLELETLGEAHPEDNTSPLGSFTQSWRLSILFSEWGKVGEDVPLGGLSPTFAWVVTVSGSPRRRLRVKDGRYGTAIVDKVLTDDELRAGEVYGVAFGSGTRFYLKVDGPQRRVRIPCDIVLGVPTGIIMGSPEPLSEPWTTPPYTLDANCEWVLDAQCRKICWISPGDIRRGYGGHFWVGLSLVMVGGDGVVRKLTFKRPDC